MKKTEKDIITETALRLNWKVDKVQKCYDCFVECIIEQLRKNNTVYFDNFGMFNMHDTTIKQVWRNIEIQTKSLIFKPSMTVYTFIADNLKTIAAITKYQRLNLK